MDPVTVKAGEPFNIMEQFKPMTLLEVYAGVQVFNCGIFFTDEFLAENPGAAVTLSLDVHETIENGKYAGKTESVADQSFVVAPTPPSVPATADNSNMPLWAGLFLAFAAVAMLTAKKRRA